MKDIYLSIQTQSGQTVDLFDMAYARETNSIEFNIIPISAPAVAIRFAHPSAIFVYARLSSSSKKERGQRSLKNISSILK